MSEVKTMPQDKKVVRRIQGPDEVLVNYRPYAATQKWFQYRFSAWNSKKAWFAMTVVILFFACGGPGFVLNFLIRALIGGATASAATTTVMGSASLDVLVAQLLGWISFAIAAASVGLVIRHPTHVSANADGVTLEWHRFGFSAYRRLPWQRMDMIDMWWPPGKTSPQDCLIRFRDDNSPKSDKYPLKLKLGAITTNDERNAFMQAIEKWGANIPRDVQLIEMLAPAQDHSYTELWLQALSAPPKRERLTPLCAEATLQDGKYVVIGQLGVGGQGTAYLARLASNGHEIVLKEFILPVYVDVNVRKQALERMQNEASMLRRLDNPRVVRLLDFFVEDHRGYLVLEKIDGISLRATVDKWGKLPEKRVVDLSLQMCEMLQYLHSLTPPVVHRDFTPDNLILGKDDILKIVDFNVAQQTESTATGTVVGKHAYISPEQFRGKPTPQSDIYSMGATLFYLLVGTDPEPITCLHPARALNTITPQLDTIVAKSTALDTAKRYPAADDLKRELEAVRGQPAELGSNTK